MNILALDLGTQTGWACNQGGQIISSSASFHNKKHDGGGMRFLKFMRFLDEFRRVDAIYYEEVRRHQGVDAAHAYGGYMATLQAFCEENKIPYSSVPVGAIKKHATGKGNASKEQMIEAAKKLVTKPIEDDNEADAICLLDYVMKNT